ncbi:bath-40 [Symbiodinium sp. CCMP2592]|nr:bath-40 [Symbiodinium sp. CCMP2592]
MALMRASLGRREVFFRKSDGSVLSGPLHSYWRQDTRRCSPVLKTTDLRSAYKQFAIRPEHHRMCVVTLKDPADGLTKGFICRVLPFGALASVGQFNRFSRLWQRILWELKLAAASYFDDFPSVEVRALAENHDSSVKAALRLFGVDWASDKDLPFSQTADVLGVRLDATDTEGGVLRVKNKPERSKEIASSIDKILADGCIDPKQIPSLFGRIQFSESQLMGRQGRLALAQIRWLSSARHRHVLSSLDATVFRSLRERMLEGRPRELQALPVGGLTLVFTDGACDKLGDKFSCSIGGVMYRVLPTGSYETRAFGCYLDESIVEQWAGLGKRHLIGPTELFAVVAARHVWKDFLNDQRVVFYVDHSGVLSAMIKGSSRDDLWRSILLHYECADSLGPAISWFARVPSKSNPSDGPSRSDWRFPVLGEYFEDRIVCFISGRVLKVTGQRVQG